MVLGLLYRLFNHVTEEAFCDQFTGLLDTTDISFVFVVVPIRIGFQIKASLF